VKKTLATIYLPLVLTSALLTGCSIQGSNVSPGQLDVEIKNAPRTAMNPETERESRALHYYLMGQISYTDENFPNAVANFMRAGELIDQPAPELHARLAELFVRSGDLNRALAEAEKALEPKPDDSYMLLLKSGILESLNRNLEAVPIYENIIHQHPEVFDAYVLLARLYVKLDQPEKGVETLKKLVSHAPKEVIGYFYLARTYEAKGDFTTAEKTIRTGLDIEPTNTDLSTDLLRLLAKQKKLKALKDYCNQLLERNPSNVLARKVLGELAIGENNFDEAISHLEAAQSHEDDPSSTRFKIALIQIEKQNFKEATRELSLVLAQQPQNSEARYYLASVYAATGRRKEAVDELAKIKSGDEIFVKSRIFAAFVLRQDGQLNKAEQVVREALDKEKDNKKVLSYLILILRDAKKFSAAEELLKKSIEKDPTNDKLYFQYAIVLNDLKNKKLARQTMEKVVELNPKNSDALNFIAYGLVESGQDLDRAKKLIDQALEIKPDDGYYLDTLGWLYYTKKDYDQSQETLARAVKLSGDDTVIMQHYGDALVAVDRVDDAVAVYKSALERARNSPDAEKDPELKALIQSIEARVRDIELKQPKRTLPEAINH
jgi:predicted Zn-dependent protease